LRKLCELCATRSIDLLQLVFVCRRIDSDLRQPTLALGRGRFSTGSCGIVLLDLSGRVFEADARGGRRRHQGC
jgi:hypothetical protein